MVTTTRQVDVATTIQRSLIYLTRKWEAIPEIFAEWETWEEPDGLDFVLEWPLRVDRLHQLRPNGTKKVSFLPNSGNIYTNLNR